MRRVGLAIAVCAAFGGALAAPAAADPPSVPPGCTVVATTPAATSGSATGLTKKGETFTRVCIPG